MRKIENSKITKIEIFDFDGTLVDTQLPESGKEIWKQKTGNDWPHVGWWGRVESLNMNIFEQKPVMNIVAKLNEGNSNDSILKVLLTGRRNKDDIMAAVMEILNANKLKLDLHLFNYGGDTCANKIEQMGKLLEDFPNVKVITFFDDRTAHIPKFKEFGDEMVKIGRLNEFIMNHVISANHN